MVITDTFLGILTPKFLKLAIAVLKLNVSSPRSSTGSLFEHIPPGVSSSGSATQASPKAPSSKSLYVNSRARQYES